ncbi:MAG: PGPGW domain-containing protein [Desulfobacterales bacterium]
MIFEIMQWVQQNKSLLLWIFGIGSIVTFLGALVGVPYLVVRIPTDYFSCHRHRHEILSNLPTVLHVFVWTAKNIIGFIFVLAGIAMLFLPGQGVLTILMGILLMSFPGKFRLACWIVSRSPVRKSINWIRKHAKKDPIILD